MKITTHDAEMASATVYYMDMRASYTHSQFNKLGRLLDEAGLSGIVSEKDLVALKLHFGEQGNTGFVHPIWIRETVKKIKSFKGIPFLTDANTLYAGSRGQAVDHIQTAIQNGFAFATVAAPIIIADGLRGRSHIGVSVDGRHFKKVYVGTEIVNADVLVSVAHFKAHELCGFGGTLKNIGMGCASRHGKLAQHAGVAPKVKTKRCVACKSCFARCSQGAISLFRKKARIDPEVCIGCGECILVCEKEAIQVQWNPSIAEFMEKMIEYTEGVLKSKRNKALFINFVTHITPGCDCLPYSDAAIVQDIGVLASRDPVAVDQAAADMVNRAPALPDTALSKKLKADNDKFRALYPKVDWTVQLSYAQERGLGNRAYRLIEIDNLRQAK